MLWRSGNQDPGWGRPQCPGGRAADTPLRCNDFDRVGSLTVSPTLLYPAQILVGLIGLVVGGNLLVQGASALAAAARVSPLVIGLTVVAFGTSAPELALTLQAVSTGSPEIAVGNVVGSNIANVLLILGASALAASLLVTCRVVRIDVPLVMVASVVLWLFALDGTVHRLEGLVLFVTLIGYIAWSVVRGKSEEEEVQSEFIGRAPQQASGGWILAKQLGLVVLGLVLLVVAARLLVNGASAIARDLGVSELVIGLTIVAVGTSLPELVTSVLASLKGQRDIAVGNVVGNFSKTQGTASAAAARSRMMSGNGAIAPCCPMRSPR